MVTKEDDIRKFQVKSTLSQTAFLTAFKSRKRPLTTLKGYKSRQNTLWAGLSRRRSRVRVPSSPPVKSRAYSTFVGPFLSRSVRSPQYSPHTSSFSETFRTSSQKNHAQQRKFRVSLQHLGPIPHIVPHRVTSILLFLHHFLVVTSKGNDENGVELKIMQDLESKTEAPPHL